MTKNSIMGSNMFFSENDNAKYLTGKEATKFIKQYIDKNLPSAEYVSEYHSPMAWTIKYFCQGAYFSLEFDRYAVYCTITIDNKEFPLWQFDRKVNDTTNSNQKCITTILNTVIKFFEEKL